MSSNGIYVWDTEKYGLPRTYEEALDKMDELGGKSETQPNPKMAAFGKQMAVFVKQALPHFGDDIALQECADIEEYTAQTLEAVFSFDYVPDDSIDAAFFAAVLQAAFANGLGVFNLDWEMLCFPDGDTLNPNNKSAGVWPGFAEEEMQKWAQLLQELESYKGKPRIPSSANARDKLVDRIIRERIGGQLEEFFRKYNYTPPKLIISFGGIQTKLLIGFSMSTHASISLGRLIFSSHIGFQFAPEYVELAEQLMPPLVDGVHTDYWVIRLADFYGIGKEESPKIISKYGDWCLIDREEKAQPLAWQKSYDDLVRLTKAAADMLMYYLPHIGTAEDFTEFVRAHNAGETDFGRLTLAETNPAKRQLYSD